MKTQTAATHVAQTWQLLCAAMILTLASVAQSFAQDHATVQNGLRATFTGANLKTELTANAIEMNEDTFQSTSVATEEVSSQNMAGQPAAALPCEEHPRFNENDTIPAAPAATPAASSTSTGGEKNQLDHFLMDKIQAVQRMIRLMELKEEIMLEKARFEQALVDLQTKIENQ